MNNVVKLPSRNSNPDEFTRQKFAWLDQVARDRSVPSDAFRVAYILVSKYLNRRRGYAFPTQDQIGAELSISGRQARTHLGKLISAGYLERKKGGSGRANEYRIALQTGSRTSCHEDQTGSFSVTDRKFERHQTGSRTSAQPYDQPSENPLIGRPTAGQPYDGRSTLDGSMGSRLKDAPHPQHRIIRVGHEGVHPEKGGYTVIDIDPETRRITVRLDETGEEVDAGVSSDVELIAEQFDDSLDDEIPFD